MNKATIPNPFLKPLSSLVGTWQTIGVHPLLPGVTLHGHANFAWIEGGAYLRMSTDMDDPQVPAGVAIFGSDDEAGQIDMLYFDERQVSRHYQVRLSEDECTWWRDHPGFSQRFTLKIDPESNIMVGEGELSRDGTTWEGDLTLTYTRIT
jgi:hypothetical protein